MSRPNPNLPKGEMSLGQTNGPYQRRRMDWPSENQLIPQIQSYFLSIIPTDQHQLLLFYCHFTKKAWTKIIVPTNFCLNETNPTNNTATTSPGQEHQSAASSLPRSCVGARDFARAFDSWEIFRYFPQLAQWLTRHLLFPRKIKWEQIISIYFFYSNQRKQTN